MHILPTALIEPDTSRVRAPGAAGPLTCGDAEACGGAAPWRERSPQVRLVARLAAALPGARSLDEPAFSLFSFRVSGLSSTSAGVLWHSAERVCGQVCVVQGDAAGRRTPNGGACGQPDVWLEVSYSLEALRAAVAEHLCLSSPAELRRLHVLIRKEAVRADVTLARLLQPRCVERGCCGVLVGQPRLRPAVEVTASAESGAGAALEAAAP